MLRLSVIIVVLTMLVVPHPVEAEELFSASESIAKQPTNWTGSITLPKFNELGVLTGLRITMESKTDWTLEVESLDEKAATVNSAINTYISLLRPNLSTLFTHSPSLDRRDDFTAYDGSVDYAGTSGNTHTFTSDDPETRDIDLNDTDATLFSGNGTVDLPITATASTNFSGAGNLRSRSTSIAGVDVSITYLYSLADLTVSISSPPSLVVGQSATFGVQVSNVGDGTSVDTITVTIPVPTGLIVSSASGDGFTCTTVNQTVTCTHPGPLASGASLPTISINTLVTSAALPSVSFSATVETRGDTNANNNVDTLSNANVTVPPEPSSGGSGGGNGGSGGGGTDGGGTGGGTGGESGGGGGVGGTQENSLTFSNELGGFGGPDIDAYNCPLSDEHRKAIAIDSTTSCFSFHPDRAVTFNDIADDPYRNVIEALRKTKIVEHGDFIVSGSGNHSSGKQQEKYQEGEFPFEPDRGSSRLEVIKLALLSNCLPIKVGAQKTNREFTDIQGGAGSDLDKFTAEVIYTASEYEIARGFEDGTARPFDRSSNAETLAFFLRAANAIPEGYSFVTREHWFDDYVNFAVANRIVPQDFDPFGTMTRSQMSNMLVSIMAINPNPAVFSYVQQLDFDTQEFTENEYAYTPTPLIGSMIVEEESTCNERDPNIVPCLAYNPDRKGLRTNLPEHHWAAPYISVLQKTFLGTTVDYMIPDRGVASGQPATRKDIVHMALTGNCKPKVVSISEDTALFYDLPKDNTSDLARLFYTAAENNIIRGYSDGTVRPDSEVSRIEALAILLRASKSIPDGYEPKPLPFDDLDDGEWYHSYVSFAVGNNIIQKTESFRPDQPMLRTELAALTLRTMRFSNDIRIRAYMTSMDPLLR